MAPKVVRAGAWISSIGLVLAAASYFGLTYHGRHFEDRVYRIGWEDDPPFQAQGEGSDPVGLAVELVKDAAQRQGVRLQWVRHPGSEASLRNGDVDLWPLMTVTPERKAVLHISDPYMQHENCFLVRAGSSYKQAQDLAAATISALALPINRHLILSLCPRAVIRPQQSAQDAIRDFCEHRADAAFVDEFTGLTLLLGNTSSCSGQPLRLISHPAMRTTLGVGATFKASAAADRIREGIGAAASDGELQRILTRWGYLSPRNIDSMTSLLNAKQREPWLAAAVGLFGVLLAIAVFGTDRIRRQMNRIKATERAFRESEQKLRLMANNLSEVVLDYDMEGRLVFANPAVEKLTGYSIADLREKAYLSLVHPDDQERIRQCFANLFRGSVYQDAEFRIIASDGRQKWLSATWGPILDDDGRQVGVQGCEREITERKLAEQALRESELRFRELLEEVQLLAIMIDRNGCISFCNDYALSITGWSAAEIVGHPAKDFLDPEYLRQFSDAISTTRPATPPQPASEGAILTKHGSPRRIQWNSTALRDTAGRIIGLASVGADITELQILRAEAAQRESEATFRNLADTAPVMIWVAGPGKGRTFFNKGWLALTGRTLDQERGDGWTVGVHPDDRDRCLNSYSSSFDARQDFQVDYRLLRADGEYRWVLDTGVPRFAQNGDLAGYIGSCVDITDLRLSQEQSVARQKLECLGVLTGGIAHDFNNLLGSIFAEAELAETELSAGASPSEEIQRIKAVTTRAAEIVRELMIYTGQDKASFEPVDLSSLVEEMSSLLKISISKRAVLETDLGRNLPPVLGNAPQIRQIVMNLIINASEAIGEKHGVIKVGTSLVHMPEGDGLRLEVSDTGCGMTENQKAKIFDPFFTTKFAGRGLGLSVVQGIVRAHGGTIDLVSAPGEGTTFRVLLECAREFRNSDQNVTQFTPLHQPPTLGTVLLVEDEAPLRRVVSRMLHGTGYSVIQAADGSDAINLFRDHKDDIGVVLLDLTIPGASSREFVAAAAQLRPDVKIILTSAYSREMATHPLDSPQIRGFIRKPFQFANLVDLLSNTLSS
jgi:PAS domain S-box-containing protein